MLGTDRYQPTLWPHSSSSRHKRKYKAGNQYLQSACGHVTVNRLRGAASRGAWPANSLGCHSLVRRFTPPSRDHDGLQKETITVKLDWNSYRQQLIETMGEMLQVHRVLVDQAGELQLGPRTRSHNIYFRALFLDSQKQIHESESRPEQAIVKQCSTHSSPTGYRSR